MHLHSVFSHTSTQAIYLHSHHFVKKIFFLVLMNCIFYLPSMSSTHANFSHGPFNTILPLWNNLLFTQIFTHPFVWDHHLLCFVGKCQLLLFLQEFSSLCCLFIFVLWRVQFLSLQALFLTSFFLLVLITPSCSLFSTAFPCTPSYFYCSLY